MHNTNTLRNIMTTAWQFVRTTGMTISEALKQSWVNFKLVKKMQSAIVKFYFVKIDGTIREAYGTLKDLDDKISGDNRAKNPSVQVYFDTEKQEFRCFKKLNLHR